MGREAIEHQGNRNAMDGSPLSVGDWVVNRVQRSLHKGLKGYIAEFYDDGSGDDFAIVHYGPGVRAGMARCCYLEAVARPAIPF